MHMENSDHDRSRYPGCLTSTCWRESAAISAAWRQRSSSHSEPGREPEALGMFTIFLLRSDESRYCHNSLNCLDIQGAKEFLESQSWLKVSSLAVLLVEIRHRGASILFQ